MGQPDPQEYIVTTLIAIQLFRDFARHQALHDLRQEAGGIAKLYSSAVQADFGTRSRGQSRRAPDFARLELEQATGDKIYFDGPAIPFPGENSGLPQLNLHNIDWTSGKALTFVFTPPQIDHYTISVTVTDNLGDSGSAQIPFVPPPATTISLPTVVAVALASETGRCAATVTLPVCGSIASTLRPPT